MDPRFGLEGFLLSGQLYDLLVDAVQMPVQFQQAGLHILKMFRFSVCIRNIRGGHHVYRLALQHHRFIIDLPRGAVSENNDQFPVQRHRPGSFTERAGPEPL